MNREREIYLRRLAGATCGGTYNCPNIINYIYWCHECKKEHYICEAHKETFITQAIEENVKVEPIA